MAFTLTDNLLRRLCEVNSFQALAQGMTFFALRGCLPADPDDQEFRSEQVLEVVACDYVHPRCTLGQWRPEQASLAVFPGSTIPHIKYIKTSLEKNGKGTNQLMTGFYRDYRKGVHKAGTARAHDAFKQTEGHPVRRTADDFDFDNDDRVEFTNPYDDIHAGWCMGINQNDYASAGCQIIVGFPRCAFRNNEPDVGAWKVFKENAYNISQQSFPYVLLTGVDAQKVALLAAQKIAPRLRFGSNGPLVSTVQTALQQLRFYEGNIDGDFGRRTARAVLDFQTSKFGPSADDGIVGPITAAALGVPWPDV